MAKSIAITDPASGGVTGVHIAEVFRRLEIADALKDKLILSRGARNAQLVAAGGADMAGGVPCSVENRERSFR